MEHIFFEKQQGNLCAQHCLNALLQGTYFSAVDLAEIGRELDVVERQANVNSGNKNNSNESQHYDDSGYFSVQVIAKALEVWGLSLHIAGSEDAPDVLQRPCEEKAFICHFNNHWFSIRKIGRQWFNLNSMQSGAKFISDTYLTLLLAQLKQEGYFIFVVRGNIPESEADRVLTLCPYDPSTENSDKAANNGASTAAKSGQHQWGKPSGTVNDSYSTTYSSSYGGNTSSTNGVKIDAESVRNKRLARFMNIGSGSEPTTLTGSALPNEQSLAERIVTSASDNFAIGELERFTPVNDDMGEAENEDADLQEAIRMSLAQS